MELALSADEQAFQTEVRDFLKAELPADIADRVKRGLPVGRQDMLRWHEPLRARGWLAASWPKSAGGPGWTIMQRHIFDMECRLAHAPPLIAFNFNMIGPALIAFGRPEQKEHYLPKILSDEHWWCQGYSEPGAGSDLAGVQTRAVRDGDHYVVNGSKTFITSGMQADFITVAVRTGGPGMGGVSLLLIEAGMDGFTRTPLRKMGWHASDTATLYFDDVRVPVGNLIGEENQGFRIIMQNFNYERLMMAAGCTSFARVCYDETVAYAQQRQTFGKRLIDHQVVRHKLVDMAMRISATQAMLESLAWRITQGDNPVAEICMLKNQATLTMEHCAREGVQTFGGAGYLKGPKVERIYREVRVNAIGGGAEEIMRDLAARQLGF